MSEEIKSLIEAQGRAFEEFKNANDARIKQVEGKGADAVTLESIAKLNASLDDIQAKMVAVEKKSGRPVAPAEIKAEAAAEHKAALVQWMRTGDDGQLKALAESKAITIGTASEGGYAVPEQIDASIEKMVRDAAPMRSICGQVTVSTSDYKKLVDVNGTASGWVAETAARTATATSALAEVVPTMGEVYANATASQQSIDDIMFDVERWITDSVSEEFAIAEDIAFVSGNGTNKPTGFTTGTPVSTADASRAFGVLQYTASGQAAAMPTSLDTFISLVYSLKAAFRNNSVFVTNKAILATLRTYKDGENQYLWQPSNQAGTPSTFLGYPVVEDENMPIVGAGNFPLAFGDFRRGYLIVDRMGTRFLRDPYTNKPNIQFYFTKRVGGKVVNSDAIKLLKIAAS